ncbi:pyridoxal-phosphate dependent enzyme [Halorubrum sp. DTA98]|uniref:pyridoxal-phosphate dependent enzyme n=1 Tax=Halorubrum sp. DTA98 TaxID=3402163 RepID=UPI003AAAB2C1
MTRNDERADRDRRARTEPSRSGVSPLRCPACGARFTDRWRCSCGRPLVLAETPILDDAPPDPAAFDTRDGLWSFDEFIAVGTDPADRVSLGEGVTPLVDAAEWDAAFKLEYVFPTGSFKDRGATTTLTRASELGVERVVEDSSGNAGAAIATYAARAGIEAEIYVPADVKDAKLRAIERTGAKAVRVEGTRADVTEACLAAVGTSTEDGHGAAGGADTDGSAWYASHAWNPAFFEGTATIAYELALQRDWTAPDAVVCPLGHGTLFLGLYWGFRRLYRAGWIDELPRLLGAQAAGVAPIVRELHGGDAADPTGVADTAADGIRIADPVRIDGIREAIADSDGDAIAVTAAALERALDRLHAAGFYIEPTSAVAPAALRAYRDRGVLDADDDVVVPLTGSGLKT